MIFRRTGSKGDCDCCGTGTAVGPCSPACDTGAARSVSFGPSPMSPSCAVLSGNDGYDLVDGVSGTTPGGVGISISGANDFRQLGINFSADMGDTGEWVVIEPGTGPITVTFTPPSGNKVCYVQFGVTNNTPGTNTTWAATVTDTGGSTSISGQNVTTATFNACDLTNSAVFAQAAPGESITSVEVSFVSGDGATPYIGIGYIAICLV